MCITIYHYTNSIKSIQLSLLTMGCTVTRMPFRLKVAVAIYNKPINIVLKDQIRNTVEA